MPLNGKPCGCAGRSNPDEITIWASEKKPKEDFRTRYWPSMTLWNHRKADVVSGRQPKRFANWDGVVPILP